jgi:ATP-dependent DNA helicase RecG
MDIRRIEELVADGESESLEFKKSTGERSRVARTICGMANANGGTVLIGVLDGGKIVGQQLGPATLEGLHRELGEIEPPLYPAVSCVAMAAARSVIVVAVDARQASPYVYRGRPFRRSGPTTVEMPQQEYQRLLIERGHASARWENQPSLLGASDMDTEELRRVVAEGVRRGRFGDPESQDALHLLRGLGLLAGDGRPLNAGAVLFGQRDALIQSSSQCVLRMTRFRGATKGEAIDSRQAVANAFTLYRLGQQFLIDHLPVAGRVVPDLFERVDDPLYPLEALREALANALCHRDYSSGAGSVDIAMYDDRLEIVSNGGLHFGLTPADLYQSHESRPWNPLFAGVFHKCGIVEQWGAGTLKIVRLTQAAGLVSPEFEERAGSLVVRFLPTGYVAPTRVDHDLSPLQRDLLEALSAMGSASLSQIRATLPHPAAERTVRENLGLLRSLGLVDSSGRGRGSRWRLV